MSAQMQAVTDHLPQRMQRWGCTLSKNDDGQRTKFVLENKERGYRGFIYVNNGRLDRSYGGSGLACMDDLYNNFYYETGLKKVECRS